MGELRRMARTEERAADAQHLSDSPDENVSLP
jgi:hypothetical protein